MPTLNLDHKYNLYYRSIPGDRDKPYLVFLHDGLGCIEMWKDFPQRLCDSTGCPGLMYDRRGYGKSDPLDRPRTISYLHDYALMELPEVLAKIIPNKPYILIGHSDGGTISLLYGATQPSQLQGIITEAAHVFVEPVTLSGIMAIKNRWDQDVFSRLKKYHGEKTMTVFKQWSETWLADWFRDWNIESSLSGITTPLLVLQGQDDQYGSPAQVNTIVRQSSGHTCFEFIEKCAHIPHMEATPVVLQIMVKFIQRLHFSKTQDTFNI
ncbi:MAG: alpha/beta fold hydrolase [Desulforhopalus sp.]